MLSRDALRQAAQSMPAVTVDSATLLALLDDADRAPKARKPRATSQRDEDAAADEKCARWLYGVLLTTMPKAKQPNVASWAKDIRLMRERDDRTRREICELFQWAHGHSFWCSNILSPAKLRDQWDRLAIQRAKDSEPKKQGGAWWASEASIRAKGEELGLKPYAHESWPDFKGRIQVAIDNGGFAPPAPTPAATPAPAAPSPAATVPTPAPSPEPARRAGKPEGLLKMMQELGRVAPPSTRAA